MSATLDDDRLLSSFVLNYKNDLGLLDINRRASGERKGPLPFWLAVNKMLYACLSP